MHPCSTLHPVVTIQSVAAGQGLVIPDDVSCRQKRSSPSFRCCILLVSKLGLGFALTIRQTDGMRWSVCLLASFERTGAWGVSSQDLSISCGQHLVQPALNHGHGSFMAFATPCLNDCQRSCAHSGSQHLLPWSQVVANSINKVRPWGGPRLTETSYGNQAYAEPSMSAQGVDQTFQGQSYQHMDQEYGPPPAQQYSQPQAQQTFTSTDDKWRVFFQDRTRSAQPFHFLSCFLGPVSWCKWSLTGKL